MVETATRKILSIGEATMDCFTFVHEANVHCTINKSKCEFCVNYADKIMADKVEFSVGGNAANTAVSFARLGFESYIYSMMGDDWIGQAIKDTLDKEGVRCDYVQIVDGPSSYATALVFQGERTLFVYHVPRDYQLPHFKPVDWIYLTSMGKNYQAAYQQVIKFAQESGAKVSFNPGTFQLRGGVVNLKQYLEITEILFVNAEEARQLTELPFNSSFRALAEQLFDFGPQIVVITDGPKGAYVFDGEKLLFCDIFPGSAVERTGAGDSFAAGFTAAKLLGLPIEEALRWGMANSASVVGKIGPQRGLLNKAEMAKSLSANRHINAQEIKD